MSFFNKLALLASLGLSAFGATIPVTASGTACAQGSSILCATQTQIVIQYTATSAGACTLTAVDNNSGPSVADLDPTLFTNADQDLSRTFANGFRWPTIVSGLLRTATIGGHDQIKKGLDGKSYSIALQANSNYSGTVSCNGGADTGTWSISTQNVPYASYYPELPIPDASQVTYGMQPTIKWADRTAKYIDPMTGVLMQRVSGTTDSYDDTNPYAMAFASPVIDVNGAAWSSPSNFITNQVAGTLATTSTVGAPLFAAFDPTFVVPGGETFTDFEVLAYGNASANTVVSTWCISVDSGQTCANGTPLNVTMSSGAAQVYGAIPTSWQSSPPVPGAVFSGWGGLNAWFGTEDLKNRTFGGVSCSGTPMVCTLASPSGLVGFHLGRAVGSSFRISGCSVGADTTLTLASTDNWSQVTAQQSGLTLTSCTYRDMSVGIRVTLNNAGTLHVSLTGAAAAARGATAGSNGERWTGGQSKVTDIATDCDGNPQSPPLSGYLVSLSAQGVFLIQDNGRMCLQSDLYNHAAGVHGQILLSGAIPFLDNKCFILPDFQSPQHIWKACHVANNYTEITVNFVPANTTDNFTWTDLGSVTGVGGIQTQAIAAGGTVGTALASGLWPALSLDVVGDDGAGNAIIQYRSTASGGDSACMLVWADKTNTLISSQALWGVYPVGYGACHFPGDHEANYSFFSAESESSQLSPIFFDGTRLLGGPFVTRSTEGLYRHGVLAPWTITISTCTKASPAVCTSTNNDLDNITGTSSTQGALITIAGATGTGWTGINAALYAHKIDNNTFSLYTDRVGASPVNSTTFGTLGGTITATMLPPVYTVLIASVVNNGGNARMVSNLTGGYARYFPSGNLVMRDGDPITITALTFNSTTQYYAKVTGAPVGDFDVYTDSALTTPASFASLSGVANQFASFAETCPDPATLTLPGPLYTDTGIGTAGSLKVRCVTIRLNDEACSDFPVVGEHATYPCSSDAANTARSSLHAINVGDAWGDTSHFPSSNHEILYVLKVTRVSTHQIDVIMERSYGDDPNYGWRGVSNGLGDYFSQQHSPGWTPWAEAPIPGGLIHTVASPTFAIPPVNGSHADFVRGATPGNVSQVSSWPSAPDSKINVSIATFTGPLTQTHQSTPFWSVSGTTSVLSSLAQSYPSMRMISGQAPASEFNNAFSWNSDWMAMNGAFGNSQNNGDGVGLTRTLTNIRGGTFDPGNTTTIVYLIPTVQPGPVNIKIAPVLVTNWPSAVLTDISGPSSLITDASVGSYCVVYTAGECRPLSTVGQVFASMRNYSDAYNSNCISNNSTLGIPCAFGLSPFAGWAAQIRNVPIDTTNTGVRRLTLAWTMPLSHYSFSNWISTPDAKWGLFADNPIQQHPLKGIADGTQWFAMKIPPTPTSDGIDRTTFVSYPITRSGVAGDTVRVAFGYGENGDPANTFCLTRAEACFTTTGSTSTNPFVFASETQGYVSCGSGCTVNVPAIPGRVLYYSVHVKNGGVETSGPLLATVVDGQAPIGCSISPSSLPSGTVGITYATTTFSNAGCASSSWSTTGTLPTGLTFNTGTGVLSGTPIVAGTYNFSVLYDTATNPFTVVIANGAASTQSGVISGSRVLTGGKVIH